MKKILKVAGIVVAAMLALMIAVPFLFTGKIEQMVKQQGNALLNAQFDYGKLDLSLFKNFPSASVSLYDFWIKGEGTFANDTLLKAHEVTATVNVMSLLGNSGYEIERIYLKNTRVKAIVSHEGAANWEVMKADNEREVEETTAEKAATTEACRVKLQLLELAGLSVSYDNRQTNMQAEVKQLNARCKGDFGSERTLMNLTAAADQVYYRTGGVALLNGVKMAADMNVDADLKHGKFVMKENKITLNAIELGVDGWMALAADGVDMDVKANTNKVGFKELLSLVPAIYAKDFEGLKTAGNVKIDAYAKGKLNEQVVPQYCVNFEVKDAMFRYPSLPAGVDAINLGMKIANEGGDLDATQIKVQPFGFNMAGHPFHVTAHLAHPVSNPVFHIAAKGKLDLGKIKEVYPMDDVRLNGKLDADLVMDGCLKDIEQEKYEQIKAKGRVAVSDMQLEWEDMPVIDVCQSILKFSPQYLELESTTVKVGKNDLTFSSRFENYMGYLLKGRTLKGNLNVKSNWMNLNDWMSADSRGVDDNATDGQETQKTTAVIMVPENIDFSMQTHLKRLVIGQMNFDHVEGLLKVKNGRIDMKNLSMKTMGGSVQVNGVYATTGGKTPHLNAGFRMDSLVFAQVYNDLGMVKKMAPVFEGLKGSFSGSVDMDADLDEQMSPVVSTMKGDGYLATRNLSLSGVKFIDQVADIVKKPSLKEINVKDLRIDFTVADGRVTTAPFDLDLGDCKMNLSGSTGLDQSIDYTGKISLPVNVVGKTRMGTVDMKIGGTFASPKVSIDMESLLKNMAGNVLDHLMGGDEAAEDGEGEQKNVMDGLKNLFRKKKK